MRGISKLAYISIKVSLCAAMGLSGCQTSGIPQEDVKKPLMYRSLASNGAQVDAEAARAMISAYRINKGLKALVYDPHLDSIAENEARAMAASNQTRSSEALKTTLRASGVKGAQANLSAGYYTLAEAFSGWRDSGEHNRTMLSHNATRMGIASAYSPQSKYGVYWALVIAD